MAGSRTSSLQLHVVAKHKHRLVDFVPQVRLVLRNMEEAAFRGSYVDILQLHSSLFSKESVPFGSPERVKLG